MPEEETHSEYYREFVNETYSSIVRAADAAVDAGGGAAFMKQEGDKFSPVDPVEIVNTDIQSYQRLDPRIQTPAIQKEVAREIQARVYVAAEIAQQVPRSKAKALFSLSKEWGAEYPDDQEAAIREYIGGLPETIPGSARTKPKEATGREPNAEDESKRTLLGILSNSPADDVYSNGDRLVRTPVLGHRYVITADGEDLIDFDDYIKP